MNKEAIKGFIAWLEGAQADEIRAHQAFILASLEDIRTAEGRQTGMSVKDPASGGLPRRHHVHPGTALPGRPVPVHAGFR